MTDPQYAYTADNMLAQLPHVLAQDRRMYALARAVLLALEARLTDLPLEQIYTRIDALPEAVLDILARDFKVDWYNFDYPVEVKRELIKTNYYVHRHLGTVGATRTAIESVYQNSTLEEWFMYGGNPYCFRVLLDAGNTESMPVFANDVLRMIYLYKSLRSHLDAIIYWKQTEIQVSVTTGYARYRGRVTGTFPARAWQISIEDHNIVADSPGAGTGYRDAHTAELNAGMFPPSTPFMTRYCGSTPGSLM